MYITLLVLLIITLSPYHKTKKAPVVIQYYKTFLESIIHMDIGTNKTTTPNTSAGGPNDIFKKKT